MNELEPETIIGTFGELLVQLRLFQYGVQAAPPLKDSGNDLIAVRGHVFKAVQVKTTTQNRVSFHKLPDHYHLLALVALLGKISISEASLDETRIFLLSREDVEELAVKNPTVEQLAPWKLNADRVGRFFQTGKAMTS